MNTIVRQADWEPLPFVFVRSHNVANVGSIRFVVLRKGARICGIL